MLELFKSRYDASSVLMPLIGLDLAGFDKKFREYSELSTWRRPGTTALASLRGSAAA